MRTEVAVRVLACASAAMLALVPVAPAAAQGDAGRAALQSPALAAELQSLMARHELEAVAVQDPDAADRFVAVLAIPDVQLLVVAARAPSVDYAKWQIEQKQYRQAYESLQQARLADERVFFQDLGGNGLPATERDGVDVMYERGVQTIFDPGVKRSGREAADYGKRLRQADAQYSRFLKLAIDAARRP